MKKTSSSTSEPVLLGLILARSGSVRTPNKNVRPFANTTLLGNTIEQAKASHLIDRLGVSTDAVSYLEMASSYGLNETYRRPANLAGSEATSISCILDYLNWHSQINNQTFTHVLLLQPTSTFRSALEIDAAIKQWRASGCDSLVSVLNLAPQPSYVLYNKKAGGALERGRSGESFYVLDGAMYIAPVEMIVNEGRVWNADSDLFVRNYPRYFDIDTEMDFLTAETLFKENLSLNPEDPSS